MVKRLRRRPGDFSGGMERSGDAVSWRAIYRYYSSLRSCDGGDGRQFPQYRPDRKALDGCDRLTISPALAATNWPAKRGPADAAREALDLLRLCTAGREVLDESDLPLDPTNCKTPWPLTNWPSGNDAPLRGADQVKFARAAPANARPGLRSDCLIR